jgi:hypothetical protein
MVDDWHLSQLVDPKGDVVGDAAGRNHGHAPPAIEGERHCDQRLQCIALRPTRWTDIGLPRADPDRKIEETRNRLGRDTGTVIGDDDFGHFGRDPDLDDRRDIHLLGGVERVVEQLLQDD